MMMIRGTVTEHEIASNTSDGFNRTTPNNLWTYDASTSTWAPNAATRAALDDTTRGPWRVTRLAQVSVRVGGGTTFAQPAFDAAIISHLHFDENSNLSIDSSFSFGALTDGDEIFATPANTFIIHRNSSGTRLYPADRCTWQTDYFGTQGGYGINNAVFYTGNSDTGTTILDPALGYIGKTGRFVEIAS